MKRPILLIIVGYVLGIIWGLYFNIVSFFILLLGITAIYYVMPKNPKRYIKVFLKTKVLYLIIISFVIAYVYVGYLNNQYDNFFKNIKEDAEYRGKIVTSCISKEYYDCYTVKLCCVNNNKSNNKYLLLYVSKKENMKQYNLGDEIVFKGEFSVPDSTRNYMGFDYKEHLKKQNIYGIVRTNQNKIQVMKINSNIIYFIQDSIVNKVKQILPKRTEGLFLGILLGKTEDIQEDDLEYFRKSSLAHILCVSGAHINYIILGITYLLSKAEAHRNIKYILTIIILIFFMAVTGFSSSVIRSVVMASMLLISKIFYRKIDVINSISISLLCIIIFNPFKLFDVGVLLSYGGTIGIIVFNKPVENILNKFLNDTKILKFIKQSLSVCISAQIVILPISIYFFNNINCMFFISNILAGPIFGAIVIYGACNVFISFINIEIAKVLAAFTNLLLEALIAISKFSTYLPFSNIVVVTPHITAIIFYFIIIFVIRYIVTLYKNNPNFTIKKLLKKINMYRQTIKSKVNMTKVVKCIFVVLIFTILLKQLPHDLRVYFIDVGQGDSCLIVTPKNKKILIDGGGSDNYDVGKNTLLPYLLDRGITKIDYIIVSHFDSDHCDGLNAVVENIEVKNIIISKQCEISEEYVKLIRLANKKKVNIIICKTNDNIKIDKYTNIEILYASESAKDLNNGSIVCKLNYKDFSMLFTGDIEEVTENEIIEKYEESNKLQTDVLKVAHHGSKTSTTPNFLELVKPKIALIGVGKNNTFGHPNEAVIKRLQDIGAKIYRTDQMGEIILRVNGRGRMVITSNN